jgi:hypothetical protein
MVDQDYAAIKDDFIAALRITYREGDHFVAKHAD